MVTVGAIGLLVRRYLRKGRAQLIVVGLLAAFAGAMLNLAALCAFRYPQMIDEQAARLRTPELQVLAASAVATRAVDVLRAESAVTTVESTQRLGEYATLPLGDATVDSLVVYLDLDNPSYLGQTTVLERDDAGVTDPVYLPYLFKSNGGYAVGDDFTITTPRGTRTFHVAGFTTNLYLGFLTMGAIGIGLPSEGYAALADSPQPPYPTSIVQARIGDKAAINAISARVAEQLSAANDTMPPTWTWDWEMLRTAALTGPGIYAVSLVGFTLVVVLVVLMVVWFWIRGTIANDLRALGVLATVGTPARQVLAAFALPPAIVVAIGALAGVAVSYAAVPVVATSLAGQTGLPWSPGVDVVSGLVIAALLALCALALAGLAALRVLRLRPVEALAGGHRSRSFRRTLLPLAGTRGNLHLLLGIKQGLAHRAQSVMVLGVLVVVSFAAMASASLFTNAVSDRHGFMQLLVGDLGEVAAVATQDADRGDLLERIDAIPGVQRAVYKDYLQGTVGGVRGGLVIMDDFAAQRYSSVFEGREPKHPNEIALGAPLADQAGVGLGDHVELSVGPRSQDYLVVGKIATVQYAGMRANVTTGGYQRLVPDHAHHDIDIQLADDASPAAVANQVSTVAGDRLFSVTNQRQSLDSQFAVYLQMMRILAWGILTVTVLVTGLVVGLMVSTLLAAERSSFGVRKALGFTGSQLLRQLVASYLPLAVAGAVVGCVIGWFLVPRLLGVSLTSIGLANASFTIAPALAVGIALVLIAVAGLTAALGASPLLRREALDLMAG
ncbi:MAG: ABC transporter permease [Micrococcales bacterium]|nr:ABC transporter permease [Micrococcales bacterium]